MDDLTLYLVLWIACGIAAGFIAQARGASAVGWFITGFLLGPIGLVAALVGTRNKKSALPGGRA